MKFLTILARLYRCTKVQRAIVVTLTMGSALALMSHLKVLRQMFLVLWARHCQVSYPVWVLVLFFNFSFMLYILACIRTTSLVRQYRNVRELCDWSGKFEKYLQGQGKVREFKFFWLL